MILRPVGMDNKLVQAPRFSGFAGGAGRLMRGLDFVKLGDSTVLMNQVIYTGAILERLRQSRSRSEFFETARRDIPGWYMWFMGNSLIQISLAKWVLPAINKVLHKVMPGVISDNGAEVKKMLLTNLNPQTSRWKQLLKTLIKPSTQWSIASVDQINERRVQLLNVVKKGSIPSHLKEVELQRIGSLFDKVVMSRTLLSAFGMIFACAAMGWGIIRINIALTNRAMKKGKMHEGHSHSKVDKAHHLAASVNVPVQQMHQFPMMHQARPMGPIPVVSAQTFFQSRPAALPLMPQPFLRQSGNGNSQVIIQPAVTPRKEFQLYE